MVSDDRTEKKKPDLIENSRSFRAVAFHYHEIQRILNFSFNFDSKNRYLRIESKINIDFWNGKFFSRKSRIESRKSKTATFFDFFGSIVL